MKAAALFVCAVCLCAQRPQPSEPPEGSGPREKERALGANLAENVRRSATVVEDGVVVSYVQRLARGLAGRCFADTLVELQVLQSGDPNGFVLPGGYMFLNTGLIRQAESEAELGGVVAHLIARAAMREGMPDTAVNHSRVPLIFMGGWSGIGFKQSPAPGAVPVSVAKRYRTAAADADARGAECLSEAGYDPEALLHSLKKLTPPEGGTHPTAAERVASAEAVIARLARRPEAVLSTREFENVKRRVEALDPVPAERRVAPSLYGTR